MKTTKDLNGEPKRDGFYEELTQRRKQRYQVSRNLALEGMSLKEIMELTGFSEKELKYDRLATQLEEKRSEVYGMMKEGILTQSFSVEDIEEKKTEMKVLLGELETMFWQLYESGMPLTSIVEITGLTEQDCRDNGLSWPPPS